MWESTMLAPNTRLRMILALFGAVAPQAASRAMTAARPWDVGQTPQILWVMC
jgi:hypothetical protein